MAVSLSGTREGRAVAAFTPFVLLSSDSTNATAAAAAATATTRNHAECSVSTSAHLADVSRLQWK